MFNASQILSFSTALIPPLNKKYRRRTKPTSSVDTPESQTTSPFFGTFINWRKKKTKIKTPVTTNGEVQVEFDNTETTKTPALSSKTPITPVPANPKQDSSQPSQSQPSQSQQTSQGKSCS